MSIASYAFRRSVLEKERTYTLFDDRLVIEGADIAPQTYPLASVRSLHLKYEHSKQREYYQCIVRFPTGRLVLRHVHWNGIGDFQDRRAAYTPFVKALLAQLARYPNVRFKAGSMVNFIGAIAGIPVLAVLSYAAYSIGRTGSAIFAAVMMSLCVLMIGPSRPRPLDPLNPPDDLLPT